MAQDPAAARLLVDEPPADHAASDLHGGLVGGLIASGAAWIAISAILLDWAWDGRVLGAGLSRAGAVWAAMASGGLAAALIAMLLGAIIDRHIRRASLGAFAAGQAAAGVIALGLVVGFSLGLELAPRMPAVAIGGAIVLAFVTTGAVLLVPRRLAEP